MTETDDPDFEGTEETRVEQPSGCRIPGCKCEGRIENMEWGSDDMPATGDSEYEETEDSPRRLSGGKDPDQPTRWIQLIYLDRGQTRREMKTRKFCSLPGWRG